MARSKRSSEKPEPRYQSILARHIGNFVTLKRALGCRYSSQEGELHLLDRFLARQVVRRITAISPALLDDFLASRSRKPPRSFNHLRDTVAHFFQWLVAQDVLRRSPLQTCRRRGDQTYVPYIFDATTAKRLLDAAVELKDADSSYLRGPTYRLIFALMYGLGLRIGEVRKLSVRDVDLATDILTIRESKFRKSRLIPFGPRMSAALTHYRKIRENRGDVLQTDDPFLTFGRNLRVSFNSIRLTFHLLIKQLGLKIPAGVARPRPHHLRHSFAVARLLAWYRSGIDPTSRLRPLSTFMGHVDPVHTAAYLTITSELLKEGSIRFERFAAPHFE